MKRIVHFEIHASQPEKLIDFYKNLFGWEFKKWENSDTEYWMIMTGPEGTKDLGINGGLVKRMGPSPEPRQPVSAFVCTIDVSNIDESVNKAVELGAKIALPKQAIPGMAWLAYCIDTDGNIFGMFQEDKNAK